VAKIETVGSEFSGVPVVLTAGIQYTDPDSVRFEKSLQFAEIARDEGVSCRQLGLPTRTGRAVQWCFGQKSLALPRNANWVYRLP
jgi:hypothetical protein